MKIFKVTLYYQGHTTLEVEANDEETAEEYAINQLYEKVEDHVGIEVNDAVVVLSDNQYTDQQELFDEHRRYEDKDKGL